MANKSMIENAPKKIEDTAKDLVHGAKDLASQAGQKVDDATAAAGRGMQSVADTIRENTPDKGMVGTAAKAATSTIESAGHYLEDKKLSGVMDDLTETIRQHPVPALAIAVGVGFVLATLLSRR